MSTMELINLSTSDGREIAVAVAILMPDEEVMKETLIDVLQVSLAEGDIEISQKIVEILGGHITNKGLEIAFKKCLSDARFTDAQIIADTMAEPERNNYLGVVLNKYLEKENFEEAKKTITVMQIKKANEVLIDHFDFLCQERHFTYSCFVADLMTEPLRSENLKKSLRGFVRNANIDGAKRTSVLLKRKLKNEDAITIFKKLMKDKRLRDAKDAAETITGPNKYFYLGDVMEEYIFKGEIKKAAEVARIINS